MLRRLRAQWNGTFGLLWPNPNPHGFGYCKSWPCKQDENERYWGQQFCQMERDISVMSRPLKVDHPHKGGPKYSGRTEPKWSVPFDF